MGKTSGGVGRERERGRDVQKDGGGPGLDEVNVAMPVRELKTLLRLVVTTLPLKVICKWFDKLAFRIPKNR